jgi:hypothetical protein
MASTMIATGALRPNRRGVDSAGGKRPLRVDALYCLCAVCMRVLHYIRWEIAENTQFIRHTQLKSPEIQLVVP